MKIGIVVYSKTGNTLSVAGRLGEKLAAAGHAVELLRLETEGEAEDMKAVQFRSLPDLAPFDAVALAAPVQGFMLCRAMEAYLGRIGRLEGKKVVCFTTKQWTSAWTGANRALARLQAAAEAAGAKVVATGYVGWKSKRRDEDIAALADRLAGQLG